MNTSSHDNHSQNADDHIDRELNKLFGQMRQSDAQAAPAFPASVSQAVEVAPPRSGYAFAPAAAMALAASLFVAVLVVRSPETPEEVYREVMAQSELTTEDLMQPPGFLRPELNDYLGSDDDVELTNSSRYWEF